MPDCRPDLPQEKALGCDAAVVCYNRLPKLRVEPLLARFGLHTTAIHIVTYTLYLNENVNKHPSMTVPGSGSPSAITGNLCANARVSTLFQTLYQCLSLLVTCHKFLKRAGRGRVQCSHSASERVEKAVTRVWLVLVRTIPIVLRCRDTSYTDAPVCCCARLDICF